METKDIQQFFNERPSLSKRAIAKEMGISRQYLNYILNDERPLTDATAKKMEPVLIIYGYSQVEKWNPPKKPYRKPTDGSRGHGLKYAHEAINKLKKIHPHDGLLQDAYDTVFQWIEHNR